MKFNIYICSTAYDKVTRLMNEILQNYDNKDFNVTFLPIGDKEIDYRQLQAKENLPESAILIFGGHGRFKALSSASENLETDTTFYDETFFDCGPKVLVAFACFAGEILGERFALIEDRSFLGYKYKLSMTDPELSPELTAWWKNVYHSIITNVLESSEVLEETVIYSKKVYRNIWKEFQRGGKEESHKYALWMRMCLNRQINGICKHPE